MIVVLDQIVAVAGSVRRALAGAGGGSRLTRAAVIASLAVLVATAVPVVLVLRTPERLTPVVLDPPPDGDLPTIPEFGTRSMEARPAASSPPAAARTTTEAPPAGPAAATTGGAPSPAATGSTSPAALRAAFAVEERALLSYGAGVTISNAGPTAVTGWTLVVTLPRESLEVTSVTGARATRAGATWTFVPDGSTGEVPGAGSVRVTFRVSGAPVNSTPTACTIDGAACSGLPA
ncbi:MULTISPECIES: cellulose binding domain-containing protein [Micromonospora]|uniref:CBM2 domain-containing protein n=1 Tax=Micromonospora sicca TaxID=2202420 RepID=A0A317CVM9_9ACTN|nr:MULTISPECIES: cellulose binding domain-containing protein [unclassified Micromonospora]MBM0227411.1 cellulose binding domain-containing protein [Micromonospora sp. ATA51]PWR06601.1 hypothetical protein DKT69_36545 [Micromonospora sp. 4G51]